MSLEEIASAIVGLIFIVLIAGVVICLGAAVYFHFTETPQLPPTVPTAAEIEQIHDQHQEYRSSKAANLCFTALGMFILGWLTGKPQFHTIGLCLLGGALAWDYKTVTAALFLYYIILPICLVAGIVAVFKGLFR